MMKKRLWIHLLFALYLLLLFRITVFRSGFLSHGFFCGEMSLVPFADLVKVLRQKPLSFLYLFFGNILWFVPFGFYCRRIKKFSLPAVVLFGFCLSFGIEILQFVFGTGISETDDLILNTAGALLGALCGTVQIKKIHDRLCKGISKAASH